MATSKTVSYLIIGNYGNDTMALIQWALEQELRNVAVLSVDTGWGEVEWDAEVLKREAWVQEQGYSVIRLNSLVSFPDLVKQRGHFPSTQFQWCANVLKGAPILQWLDNHDLDGNCILLMGHRRNSGLTKQDLPPEIVESEIWGGRTVRHPLIHYSTEERDALLMRANFPVLTHRSLECRLCVNSDAQDVVQASLQTIAAVSALETSLGKPMFENLGTDLAGSHIEKILLQAKTHASHHTIKDVLDNMGCGDAYSCGI